MLRYLWALPNTVAGLPLLACALVDGHVRVHDGVLEVHGPVISTILRRCVPLRGGASAITFGHIVAARDGATLAATRVHERVHVRQCERWGPAFMPAYLLAGFVAFLRGTGAYDGNYFERQARNIEMEMLGLRPMADPR